MNKYEYNKDEFDNSLRLGVVVLVIVYGASYITGTPKYIAFLLASIIFTPASIYLLLMCKNQKTVKDYLAHSVTITFMVNMGAMLAYLDFLWFDEY